MVYCTKCGAKNEDDAKFCVNCGGMLYPEKTMERREETCFGQPGRRIEEGCFGLPYGGTIVAIIFGIFIILLGIGIALRIDIGPWVGAFVLLVIGILIIAGALYGLSRRRG